MSKTIKILLISLLLAVLPASVVLAIPFGSGAYGVCVYSGCSITITSNSSVSLNVTPTGGGSCTIQSDTVGVKTQNAAGYSLSITDYTTDNHMINGSHTLPTTSGTTSAPASLSNDWGFRVDGLDTFGSGPTTAQSNVATGSTGFAGIPPSDGTPVQIASTSTQHTDFVYTTIWYGLCADTSVASGTYTTDITYTAVRN